MICEKCAEAGVFFTGGWLKKARDKHDECEHPDTCPCHHIITGESK